MNYTSMLDAVIRAIKTVTQKNVTTCINSDMGTAIELWAAMYEDRPPWLSSKQGIISAGIPSAMCAELSRLSTCELITTASNPSVDDVYQQVVRNIRTITEYGCALGGVLIKPYEAETGIVTQTIRADRFFPLAFDSSGNMSEVVLVEQLHSGKRTFTRLEYYSLPDRTIYNLAFVSSNRESIGNPTSLDSVPQWAGLQDQSPLGDKLPFGYFKIPLANTIDMDSPLGISVFGRAAGLIREADKKYSNICWEYEAKQAAIHIAQNLLKRNDSGSFVYPGGKERLYRALEYNVGAMDKPLLDVFSPDIRAEQLFRGYQNQLKMIEFACGLAYGTISDPASVDRTATEVRSSKQRLYVTVTDIQTALEYALRNTVEAIASWMGGSADVSFEWGDSVMMDTETVAKQALLEIQSGVIDNVEYYKRVYGLDQASAETLANEIAARGVNYDPDA